MEISQGLPPMAGDDARVLILGTMPGLASLARRQYYAHPRNAFWPIMGHLFGANPNLDYPLRCQLLMANRVAVWDVVRSCQRRGSLDAAIRADSVLANPLAEFIASKACLMRVFFNGKTAAAFYRRHVLAKASVPIRPLAYHCLPSTSPAFAGLAFAHKLAAWKAIQHALTTCND